MLWSKVTLLLLSFLASFETQTAATIKAATVGSIIGRWAKGSSSNYNNNVPSCPSRFDSFIFLFLPLTKTRFASEAV